MDVRKDAMARMVNEASRIGGDAVVNDRDTASMTETRTAELFAYGTAVKLQRAQD